MSSKKSEVEIKTNEGGKLMNYHTECTAEECIPCSKKRYEAVASLLEDSASGMYCEWVNEKLFLYADDGFCASDLSQEVLSLVGHLLELQDKEYLEFGVAYYADRTALASTEGERFRIYKDGSIIYQHTYWPEDEDQPSEDTRDLLDNYVRTLKELHDLNERLIAENASLRLRIAKMQRDIEDRRQDRGAEEQYTGEVDHDAGIVGAQFTNFLMHYVKFCAQHGLSIKRGEPRDAALALGDMTGRVQRQVKHLERSDALEGYDTNLPRQIAATIVYAVLVAAEYELQLGHSMALELASGVRQHATQS